ncbi:hypothetical protein M404DRAFT_992270 [Pisolithus tinctorius Marx 270]|uniref:Uncharacterized protein n=1 Tax=Pisolithus tinctorius Marx 270 TaxID=870435 RepID=A0A0C3PX60_PISTI|nr:hypothetical protein M404DRAFT_992270 [Pisolithus tinctorius Marx 270]
MTFYPFKAGCSPSSQVCLCPSKNLGDPAQSSLITAEVTETIDFSRLAHFICNAVQLLRFWYVTD